MKNKKHTDNKIKEMNNRNMKNFIDVQSITILMYLSKIQRTRAEMVAELREIPSMSLYRKINKMEKCGLVCKVTSSSSKKKRDILYENTADIFVMRHKGKSIQIVIC